MGGQAGATHGLRHGFKHRVRCPEGYPVSRFLDCIGKLLAISIASAIVVLALAASVSSGQEVRPGGKDPSKAPPAEKSAGLSSAGKAEIDQAVADLGSPDFVVRERASRKLWNAGAEATPALEKAVRETNDFEVAYRAQQLLELFQLGIYADTPAETVSIIGQFQMGNFAIKQQMIANLKQKGKTDLVRRLIAAETSPAVREQLNQVVANTGRVYSPRRAAVSAETLVARLVQTARNRIANGEFDQAERLLSDAASDDSVRNYAAFLLSRKKLDAAIAQLRVNLKATDDARQRRLAWMLRAKGDLAGAVAAAKLVKDDELVKDLLAEMADWKELAKIDAKADLEAVAADQNGAQKLARIVTIRHLAGEKQACDQAAAVALKVLKQRQFRDRQLLGALVLNDRVNQVIGGSTPQDVMIAFELLVDQSRLKEAFRLVKIDVPVPAKVDWKAWLKDGKADVSFERLWFVQRIVRALRLAGEQQSANELTEAMLASIGERLQTPAWEGVALSLLQLEVEVGRPEASDALAAKLLALNLKNPQIVFALLYRDQAAIAPLVWKALRKQVPGEDRPAALKHLRRLLTSRSDATALEELRRMVSHLEPQLESDDAEDSSDNDTDDLRARKLLALAMLFHRHGDGKLAAKYLALIPATGVSVGTLIEEGNLYVEAKQWSEAAKSYKAAWDKDRRSASALYLWGWAETKTGATGAEAQGRKSMEAALTVSLADGESRREFVRTLVRLHQDDEAARQRQWLLRLAATHDRSIVQTLMEIGDAAAEKADGTNSAAVWQRVSVELLSGSVFLSDARYYFHPPVSAHSARACELLRTGNTAAGIEELHQAEALQPANIQVALDCDAELRKHGAAGEADALYRRMLEQHEALCRDFPNSGTYHNDLAWLSANLDRDLDKALAHAQRAVALEPQSAGILDTLAEVYFRRGDRAKAVRLTRRCLEMEPEGEHYKKQLARFETNRSAK